MAARTQGIQFSPWIPTSSRSSRSGRETACRASHRFCPPPPRSNSCAVSSGAGLRRIEVASFVNPKRVPQMADAEGVLAALAVCAQGALHRPGTQPQRFRSRARGRLRRSWHGDRRQRILQSDGTRAAVSRRVSGTWLEIAKAARSAGIRAQITISTAFGCPFEGEVPPARVVALAERLSAGDPDEIAIADTIGVAVPTQVTALVGALRASLPRMKLRAHFHNTRNTGLANAYAAIEAGVRSLDASCGGIGGCPFAPAATGNVPTRRSDLYAASNGFRHRRRSAGTARNHPLAATDTRSRRARHGRQSRAVSGSHARQLIH